MQSNFISWFTRMNLVKRWSLLHCTQEENISEHSHQVAVIAHTLATIKNVYFGGEVNADRCSTLAIYHEVSETKLQDLNSVTKYSSAEFTKIFKRLEDEAERECLNTLPVELQESYKDVLVQSNVEAEYKQIVKAADILSAYLKAKLEVKRGNPEFDHVIDNLRPSVWELTHKYPEVEMFMRVFYHSANDTLDKIQR